MRCSRNGGRTNCPDQFQKPELGETVCFFIYIFPFGCGFSRSAVDFRPIKKCADVANYRVILGDRADNNHEKCCHHWPDFYN